MKRRKDILNCSEFLRGCAGCNWREVCEERLKEMIRREQTRENFRRKNMIE